MNNKMGIVLLLVVLVGGGLWLMQKPASSETVPGAMERLEPTSKIVSPDVMVDDTVKEIMMDGGEFFFTPATLTLKKGEKVRLVFKNVGKMPHDFVVDELGVRTAIIKGEEQDLLEFTPTEAGTFEYYCSVGQHRANGMKGTMTVQ